MASSHKAPATRTPKDVAREVSTRLGRKVDAKRVRAWVRDNVDAYDDDGYTAHLYDATLYRHIVDSLVKRGRAARPTAASRGRSKPASKPTTARAMGSGPVTRVKAPKPTVAVTAAPDAALTAPVRS